jgi:NADH-quinone oxidoreductase subunit C
MDAPSVHNQLKEVFGDRILHFEEKALQPWAVVTTEAVDEIAAYCKNHPELLFDNLACLSGVDYPKETPPRMEVVYHLFSYKHRHSFVLKVHVPREDAHVPTVEGVWGVANWHEREAYDMFGIVFDGHSDLRRILLPDDWIGHPLRKDWVDPDFYNGMHVKPTQQMADRAMAGEKIGVGPFDVTPPNRHVPSSE